MVTGTASEVGKSVLVAGICRSLARRGVKVAPFKGQNMSLNSYVAASGGELGRAQASQAMASGVDPEVAMNPVLLKPTAQRTSQVVVMGSPVGEMDAASYQGWKEKLRPVVMDCLEDLRSRFDVVVCEGAGSPAEINLPEDLTNLSVAVGAGLRALLVGDVDRGGVFAALHGTLDLLPPEQRAAVGGLVVNKLRGDGALLRPGLERMQRQWGIPVLGVVPHCGGLGIDAEDSVALDRMEGYFQGDPGGAARSRSVAGEGDVLDVAVVRLPRLSNFTDFEPLLLEQGMRLRYVTSTGALGDPDLVVLPGSKATVGDLEWLRRTGMADAVEAARLRGTSVLGICAGLQMMGRTISDHVESGAGSVAGLGWAAARTVFGEPKVTARRTGATLGGIPVAGYQIHQGRVHLEGDSPPWFALERPWGDRYGALVRGEPTDPEGRQPTGGDYDLEGCDPEGRQWGQWEGIADPAAGLWGTTLHGIFEQDHLRQSFLTEVGRRRDRSYRPSGASFEAARQAMFDRMADLVDDNLDRGVLDALIDEGAPR